MTRKTGAHHCQFGLENKPLQSKKGYGFTVFLEHNKQNTTSSNGINNY